MSEAVNIARKITAPHDSSFHELSEPQNLDSHALTDAVMDLAASVKGALCKMTDEHFVSQAMAGYPRAPYSDLVCIFLCSFSFFFFLLSSFREWIALYRPTLGFFQALQLIYITNEEDSLSTLCSHLTLFLVSPITSTKNVNF